jgi:hypothetical protein
MGIIKLATLALMAIYKKARNKLVSRRHGHKSYHSRVIGVVRQYQ